MKKITRRQLIFLILTILMMAFIFFQSALPADLSSSESDGISLFAARLFHWDIDLATFVVRKTGHFLEYLILGIFLTMALLPGAAGRKRREEQQPAGGRFSGNVLVRSAFFAWVIGTAYAVTDEIHQIFVEGRSGEVRDVCIDAAGVLAGVLILCLVRRIRSSR